MDDNIPIEREAQRRVASALADSNRQIADLQDAVVQCQRVIVQQHDILKKLTGEPLCHGTIIHIHAEPDPMAFQRDDEILVTDESSPYYNYGGSLTELPFQSLSAGGLRHFVTAKLLDLASTVVDLRLDQIRLTTKDDGSFAIVLVDGKHWEVKNVIGLDIDIGQTVKIHADSKKIVGGGYELVAGPVCHVAAVHDDGVEIDEKGEKRFVTNPRNLEVTVDDRVVVDGSFSILIRTLPCEDNDRYRISEPNVSWDDIGGLEDAKRQIRSAIELPFKRPDVFAHYKMKRPRGILLFGPPGNGKTLLVRAAAHALAEIHGKQAVVTGYRYVKSPELLDKWIGNTERAIRNNFNDGRQHFRQFGYPALHVYDEAEAIMPQRGSRRSSDIADTMVPMFLGEMDGADETETEANPIVFLLSNRADTMDPAITRPGRISRHIKIDRPDLDTALTILGLHSKECPFAREQQRRAILAIAANDLYSKGRLLYRVNNEHDFTLGDAVSGAMLVGIVEEAKDMAMHRDLESGNMTGVTTDDFKVAIDRVFHQQRGMNHSYDLTDFAENHGLQPNQISVDRVYGAA